MLFSFPCAGRQGNRVDSIEAECGGEPEEKKPDVAQPWLPTAVELATWDEPNNDAYLHGDSRRNFCWDVCDNPPPCMFSCMQNLHQFDEHFVLTG